MKTIHHLRTFPNFILAFLLTLSLFTANVAISQTKLGTIPEFHPELGLGALQGYLEAKALPNSLALIPPPPDPSSAAFALDVEVAQNTFALRNTPRFELAASDYDLKLTHFIDDFSCSLNVQITKENAPYLYNLLCRSFTDIGMSTYAAKNYYKRKRPFQVNGEPIAVPEAKSFLEKDPSYPSGHTALGWGFALILSEIDPDHANRILDRGRVFGESRIVCNHHWYSDVVWGRFMGAATVARLHADITFLADMEAAKAEFAAIRAKGLPPTCNCKEETDALALGFQASSVTAIDILLDPDQTMLDSANVYNNIMNKDYQGPGSFKLDETHTPHITVLQCFVRNADLEKVYAAVAQVVKSENPANDALTASGFYYIPLSGLGLAGITAKTTPKLLSFQAKIIEVLA